MILKMNCGYLGVADLLILSRSIIALSLLSSKSLYIIISALHVNVHIRSGTCNYMHAWISPGIMGHLPGCTTINFKF